MTEMHRHARRMDADQGSARGSPSSMFSRTGLDDMPSGAVGLRFRAQDDGSGLHCLFGGRTNCRDSIGERCRAAPARLSAGRHHNPCLWPSIRVVLPAAWCETPKQVVDGHAKVAQAELRRQLSGLRRMRNSTVAHNRLVRCHRCVLASRPCADRPRWREYDRRRPDSAIAVA